MDQQSIGFIKKQQELFMTGITNYIVKRQWTNAFADVIISIVMRAFNLRIILFKFNSQAWFIQSMESADDSSQDRRCIYLRHYQNHYEAVVKNASRIFIERVGSK